MATPKQKFATTDIDFDAVIVAPDGNPLKEMDPDSRENPPKMIEVTLKAVCYAALMGPNPKQELTGSVEGMLKVAQLAHHIMSGQVSSLTTEQRKLILDRMLRFPPSYVWGVVRLIDPAAIPA
jgi:hypothetical protein